MTGVTFCSLACGRGRSNAVVSLGEKHRERNLWTGGWCHHLFSGGWQPFLQFWCNIIQGLHHQQLLLDILVAAIHNTYIYIFIHRYTYIYIHVYIYIYVHMHG